MTTSVRTKILLPLIVGLLVLGAIGVLTMHRYFAQRLTEQAMLRVEILADAIRKSVETNASVTQQRRLVSAFGSTPGVNLIVLVAGDPPRVLASTFSVWSGESLDNLPEKAIAEDLREALRSNAASRHYHHETQEYDFTLPLLLLPEESSESLVRGAVMVHLDARSVNHEIMSTTVVWSGLYLLLLVAVAGAIYAMVYRWVLRPIAHLQRAVSERAGGDERARSPRLPDDELGQLGLALNTLMDQISQEKSISGEYNERLKDSESRTRAILDSVHEGIIFADSKGTIHSVNPGAEAIFGCDASDLVGQNLRVLMPPEMGAQHDGYMRNYSDTRIAKIIGIGRELEGQRKDGSVFPLELAIAEVMLGGETFFTGIVRDITERKRAEEALVAARDAALAAARMKSEFVATMSHEIRTPMNGVLGMAQVLGKTPLSSDQRQYVDTIVKSGKALLTVLNDILDFSKIEAGRLDLESLDFNLERTIKEVVQLYSQQAFNKNLELAVRYGPDCPRYVNGDPGRMRQILLNLVGNALKFTDKGHVLVDVSMMHQAPGRVTLRIAVQDSGIGLSLDAQAKLFSAFSQADASTTRKYGGTGLGLAICKRLVELMGGQIGVSSAAGDGATFWFSVPFALVQSAPELPKVDLSSTHALVVSYSELGGSLLREQLDDLGVSSVLVESNGAALEAVGHLPLQGRKVDVVILDVNLSDSADQALVEALRAGGSAGRIPIVVLTSVPMKGDGQRLREACVDGYLAKPVTTIELRDMLGVVLGRTDRSALETRHTIEDAKSADWAFSGKVLLAEDVDFNQMVVKTLLEQFGLEVDIANNGDEAVRAFSTGQYQLILMDCQMPVLDGYDATRKIRSMEPYGAHIPVIALTANALESDRQKCLDSGMDDFIPKPIEESLLRSKLTSWLRDGSTSPARAQVQQSSHPPVDEGAKELCSEIKFQQLKKLMRDKFEPLVESFIANAERKLEVLNEAAIALDADTLHKVGHALKGIAGNIGAVRLQELAAELEKRAQAGDTDEAVERVREMSEAFALTRQWLLSRSAPEASGIV